MSDPMSPDQAPEMEGVKTQESDPATPVQPALKLSARQFVRARGHRWERSAGFLLDQANTLGREARLTIAEWQSRWDAYWQRTVR